MVAAVNIDATRILTATDHSDTTRSPIYSDKNTCLLALIVTHLLELTQMAEMEC